MLVNFYLYYSYDFYDFYYSPHSITKSSKNDVKSIQKIIMILNLYYTIFFHLHYFSLLYFINNSVLSFRQKLECWNIFFKEFFLISDFNDLFVYINFLYILSMNEVQKLF
jgi:hypothetical protein